MVQPVCCVCVLLQIVVSKACRAVRSRSVVQISVVVLMLPYCSRHLDEYLHMLVGIELFQTIDLGAQLPNCTDISAVLSDRLTIRLPKMYLSTSKEDP